MYNLLLLMLLCYALKPSALRLPNCYTAATATLTLTLSLRVCVSYRTVLCGALYTACVDASRTVFWDRSMSWFVLCIVGGVYVQNSTVKMYV